MEKLGSKLRDELKLRCKGAFVFFGGISGGR